MLKKIINIPWFWKFFQNLVGADPWKLSLYPKVFKKPGKILDFGCSIGNSVPAFLDFEYYGVDIDKNAIDTAKKTYSKYKNITFSDRDILISPFKPEFFDYILFACTGHHLTTDYLNKCIDVLLKELKPGGELHFFDVIKQVEKDKLITQFFVNYDQGKYMRTIDEYKKIFVPNKYKISNIQIFPSPDKLIKLQDMFYLKIVKQ